jgi:ankyrin repeat protein
MQASTSAPGGAPETDKLRHAPSRHPAGAKQATRHSQWPALHTAARRGDDKAVTVLLDHCADIDKQDDTGNTALHVAVFNGHTSVVKVLIQRQAKFDIFNGTSGDNALHLASIVG